jgi:mRNA-capping enzyme
VSMDVRNISKLAEKPYMVSWKADGTRYLMLIEGPGLVYFIDRDNSVFTVQTMTFPCRKDLHDHLFETLVDGVIALASLTSLPFLCHWVLL